MKLIYQRYLPQKENFDDFGLISIMYHRFNENKYPSTNIQLDIFKEHLDIIEKEIKVYYIQEILKKSLSLKKKKEKFYLQLMMAYFFL